MNASPAGAKLAAPLPAMTSLPSRSLLCFATAFLLSAPMPGAEVFVAPDGRDAAGGTREQPFRTLERARDEVRRLRNSGHLRADETATIWLRGGTYALATTFALGPADSGQPGAPLIVAAAPGENVRLTGGVPVPSSALHPVTDPAALRRLPAEAAPHVLAADLRTLAVKDFGQHRQFGHGLPVVPSPMEIFWDDRPLPLARYPNQGAILMGPVVDPGSIPRTGDYSNRPGSFQYTDPRHERWQAAPDVWLQGYFHYGFADDKIRVAAVDPATRTIKLAAPHLYGLGSGENFNQYVALNLLEELDAPGEWYVDSASGTLFLWPPADPAAARIVASILESPLVAIENASDCELRNLVIENGRGIGVYLEGGARNRLEGCTIRNLGTVGVMIGQGSRSRTEQLKVDGYEGDPVSREVGTFHAQLYHDTVWDRKPGTGHIISRCEVFNTGSGGIILGGGSKKDLVAGNCVVTDCRIHEFSRRNKAGAAGVIVDGCGNRVTHCEIFDGDLQAIIVHGNDHLFDYNHIHHVSRDANDASAWYLGRDPSDQGNVVRWNFFHDVGRPDRKWTMGVYCDDATCGVLVEGNVFHQVASYGTVYSNGGHDIQVRNNIFIGGYGPAFQLKSMWYDFGHFEYDYYFGSKGIYLKRLLQAVDIRKPPYSTRYPLLKDWLDLGPDGHTYVGMLPRRNVFERNVLYQFEETFRLVGQHAQCDYGENFLTRDDPGFVDAAKLNFQLRDDSPVYRALPGFQRIPFNEIGPRR